MRPTVISRVQTCGRAAVSRRSIAGGRAWVSTAEVAEAAGVSEVTIRRWVQRGVMPAYEVNHGGRRGHAAMWPPHAPQQARWVLEQLEARRTWEDIAAALEAGEFKATLG